MLLAIRVTNGKCDNFLKISRKYRKFFLKSSPFFCTFLSWETLWWFFWGGVVRGDYPLISSKIIFTLRYFYPEILACFLICLFEVALR